MMCGRTLIVVTAMLFSGLIAGQALAVQPGEMLKDPALEKRARGLSAELRCLVCQNQSIDDSDAPLAHDLRVLVRERLTAGDSDDDVRAYVVARYGDFVLLKPPFNWQTLLLWIGPLLILVGAVVMTRRSLFGDARSAATRDVMVLSAEEELRLAKAMKDADASRH